MINKKQKTNKDKIVEIRLGHQGETLPWNGSHEQRCNEYFFGLIIDGEFRAGGHHGLPCTRGRSNADYIRESYVKMIEEETTKFAKEMKGVKNYQLVNGWGFDFFHPNYASISVGNMSDDAKKDFLSNLEAKLKGSKKIDMTKLTYDYNNFRDRSMDGAPC
ncbi:MAG: hypothetical protein WCK29_02100 [archaeon]